MAHRPGSHAQICARDNIVLAGQDNEGLGERRAQCILRDSGFAQPAGEFLVIVRQSVPSLAMTVRIPYDNCMLVQPSREPNKGRTVVRSGQEISKLRSEHMAETGGFRLIFRTLANPNFGIFTGGHSISIIGTWMQRIAVGWLAWQLTQSPAWLGALAFANLGPSVFIGPVASVLADRKDRLRVIFVSQSLAMGQAIALF